MDRTFRTGRRYPITAVIVSRDRYADLEKTVLAVLDQSVGTDLSVIIVDSSANHKIIQERFREYGNVAVMSCFVNLGGAGGFAFGILNALASGAEWIWLMDDDGRPHQNDTLERLLREANSRKLDAVAPIVLNPDDVTRFAFPYPINNRYVINRDQVPKDAFILSTAHLFNGLLIRAASIFSTGLPDPRLFIRGDEINFLLRMRRAKLRFGTVASAAFTHPSSDEELYPILGGRLRVVYPQARWKRRIQYRNRAYNHLQYGMFLILAIDLVRYPYFFMVKRRFDIAGLVDWIRCTCAGLLGRIEATSIVTAMPERMVPLSDEVVTEVEFVT